MRPGVVIIFMCAVIWLANGHQNYSNTPITKSPGIYYEHIRNLKFYETQWNLLSYIPIQPFSDKLNFLDAVYQKTVNLCENKPVLISLRLCDTSLKLLSQIIPQLFQNEQNLKNLISNQSPRPKRALFNAVGSIFKTLFGTLDSTDAEYYNKVLEKTETNENHLLDLLKQQIQVVKTTISNFNNSIINLDNNKEIFDRNFELIKNYTSKLNKKYFDLDLKQKLEEHFTLLNFFVTELQEEYSTLINTILFAKSNNLHPSVITPEQLIQELSKTVIHLPSATNYPIPLSMEYAHKYFEIISLKYRYFDNKLLFVISVPLVSNVQYTLYNLISLPIFHPKLNQLTFILPSVKYLALSENRNIYTTLDTLDNCHPLSDENLICKSPDAFHFTHVRPICETALLTPISNIPSTCDTRVVHTQYEIWHRLSKPNSWIYVLPKATDLTLSCPSNTPISMILSNTGIFSTPNNCKIYTGSTILVSSSDPRESEFQSIIPDISLSEDCCNDIKAKNESALHLIPLQLNNLDRDALNLASHKLDTLEKLAVETNTSFVENIKSSPYFIYIILTIGKCLLGYALYRISKYFYRRCTRNPSHGCQVISNYLTLNICQTKRKNKTETELSIDCSHSGEEEKSNDMKMNETTPIRKSERLAKLKEMI